MAQTMSKFINKLGTKFWFNGYLLLFVLAVFLPRVVKKGLFGDGLLYASMARNMADGQGSIWAPFFSTSYWIPDMPTTYYENPPLMLWLESHFFFIFGDQWWTEKLYAIVNMGVNVALLILLWRLIQSGREARTTYGLPVFAWCLIPLVLWGNVNNLMDNTMLSFCLLAILTILKGVRSTRLTSQLLWTAFGGFLVFLGILAKGPVALYPLPIPLVYGVVFGFEGWDKAAIKTTLQRLVRPLILTFWIAIVVAGFFGLLFWLQPKALEYFTQYFDQRLMAVINGTRSDQKLVGWERLYILYQLLLENSILIAISVGIGFASLVKRVSSISTETSRWIFFFMVLGLGATLPILASTKQSGIYLIPGIPMFAVAASLYWNSKGELFKKLSLKLDQYAHVGNILLIVLYLGVLGLSYQNIGKLRREKALIEFLEQTQKIVPSQSIITVNCDLINDFVYHTYFQRMGRYAIHADTMSPYFFDDVPLDDFTNKIVLDQKYKLVYEHDRYRLYTK